MPAIREPGWQRMVVPGSEILARLAQHFTLIPLEQAEPVDAAKPCLSSLTSHRCGPSQSGISAATGRIAFDEDHTSRVGSPISGRVEQILVKRLQGVALESGSAWLPPLGVVMVMRQNCVPAALGRVGAAATASTQVVPPLVETCRLPAPAVP